MNELVSILDRPSTFLTCCAPPGWGKTSMLLDLYQNHKIKFVYLSPLRAIAEELYERLIDYKGIIKLDIKKECEQKIKKFSKLKKAFLITTPELLDDRLIFRLSLDRNIIFVIDELHLFYYWGESFREKMWEVFMGVCNSGRSILALTATLDIRIMGKLRQDLYLGTKHSYLLDIGNQKLKADPYKQHIYLSKKQLIRRLYYEVNRKQDGTILYFCRYRKIVDKWVKYFKKQGVNVLGCKGGEALIFREQLKENSNPKCIIATSVLGHGVNLPQISKVFIDYQEDNFDFYLQMIGRGGRSGEKFEIFGFNHELISSKKDLMISYIKSFLFDMLYLKFREYFYYADKG